MRESDLPFDRTKHRIYTKNAKKCVQKLLSRYYDRHTAAELWEKIQLQYCEYLKDEPALAGSKITVSIYDPILIFAWYAVIPDKPPLKDIQQGIYDCFMGSFDLLGRIFDLNRKPDNRLAGAIFRKTSDLREEESRKFPGSFRMGGFEYDKENGVVTAFPSVRMRNLPGAIIWRMCFPSCATATIWPCGSSMPCSSARERAAQAHAVITVSWATEIRSRQSMS